MVHIHLEGLYKQSPWPLEERTSETLIHSSISGEKVSDQALEPPHQLDL